MVWALTYKRATPIKISVLPNNKLKPANQIGINTSHKDHPNASATTEITT